MHKQVERPKENKSRAIANSVAQKKGNGKQGFGFVDNRLEAAAQQTLRWATTMKQKAIQHVSSTRCTVIQRVYIGDHTVINNNDIYATAWQMGWRVPQRVQDGPRAEAQLVGQYIGGDWVGGHMINDMLWGAGDFTNIVPITNGMNNRHHTIENFAQEKARNGFEYDYQMNILAREDIHTGPNGYIVRNLPMSFQQTVEWRTPARQGQPPRADGRPHRAVNMPQAAGPIQTIVGQILNYNW